MHRRRHLLYLAVALLPLHACDSFEGRERARELGHEFEADEHPRPTENGMDEDVERGEQAAREAWIERMHLAPRGVDWRAIERENGEREMERRNALAHSLVLPPITWAEVGSRNQAGRIHVAARGPGGGTSPRLYAGADGGGVWRANADGTSWTPLSDNLYGGCNWLAILPGEHAGDPDVVVAATNGGSVHVSRDQGLTWETPAGLPALSSCRGLAALADAGHTILVYGQFESGGTKPGIFASTDFGRTFTNRWTGAHNFAGWMWVPRIGAGGVDHVYIVQKGRCYVSTDGALSFTPSGTANASAASAILTGSEAGAPTLYTALSVAGVWKLYRSDDAGVTWTYTIDITDMWDGTLCASTLLPNLVMFGGLEVWRSSDSGLTFTHINGWGEYYGNPAHKLHADIPGIFCWPDVNEPLGSELWYIGTDGGLFVSPDQGLTVNNLCLSGLGVSQYYSTLTSRTNTNLILAGSQDQGYQRGVFQPPSGPGPSTDFTQLISGDYGHLTSSDGSHNVVYCCYPGFVLVQQGQNNPALAQVNFPAGSAHDWLPMVTADPTNPNAFFFCGERLYRYVKTGSTWTPSVHSTFNFLTPGASFITAIGVSRTNPMRMYAANDAGGLFYSSDHGVNWTASASPGPSPHYFYGSAIAVHPTNELEAVVGGSGYGTAGVRRTIDGGVTWTAIATGLPQTMTYSLAYAEDGTGDVFAACDAGAFQWVHANGSWTNIMQSGTPIATYWSVEVVENGTKARFATYARGIWDYTIPPIGPQAAWIPYGIGLGGANTLTLDSHTLPHIGTNPVLDVTSPIALPTRGWIFASTFGGTTTLFGGTFLADPVSNYARILVDTSGHGSSPWRIPNDPSLIGQSLYFQAVLIDSTQAQGFALSNGLEAQFGP